MSNTIRQHAKQQEERVREVLTMLHEAMIDLDTPHDDGTQTSYFIDYDEQDMFHAATIFYHVCSNYAIKHGYLNGDNVYEKVSRFREMVKETFGLDTIQEAKIQVLLNSVKNDNKSENNK
jgi:hypothetical protein